MTIAEYKEATVKLREFVKWSKENYTRTPKMSLLRAKKIAEATPFSVGNMTEAFIRLSKHYGITIK